MTASFAKPETRTSPLIENAVGAVTKNMREILDSGSNRLGVAWSIRRRVRRNVAGASETLATGRRKNSALETPSIFTSAIPTPGAAEKEVLAP